jgi:hypothetical protein
MPQQIIARADVAHIIGTALTSAASATWAFPGTRS